jgi:hypothetical protein
LNFEWGGHCVINFAAPSTVVIWLTGALNDTIRPRTHPTALIGRLPLGVSASVGGNKCCAPSLTNVSSRRYHDILKCPI